MAELLDLGVALGALGVLSGIASAAYSRRQVAAAQAQLQDARLQATEALRAAELVAKGAQEQASEALRAAALVAENARRQADAALRAAELLALSDISARLRAMRASNLASNPKLPEDLQELIRLAGGPDAYSVLVDAMEVAQEVYELRKGGAVTAARWRAWMHDDLTLVVGNPAFERVFRRAASQGELTAEFVAAFEPVLRAQPIADPTDAA